MEPGNAQLSMTVLMTPDMANFSGKVHGGTGNTDTGFAEADAVHEGTYVVPRAQHAHLETHAGVGWVDESGTLTIRSSISLPA